VVFFLFSKNWGQARRLAIRAQAQIVAFFAPAQWTQQPGPIQPVGLARARGRGRWLSRSRSSLHQCPASTAALRSLRKSPPAPGLAACGPVGAACRMRQGPSGKCRPSGRQSSSSWPDVHRGSIRTNAAAQFLGREFAIKAPSRGAHPRIGKGSSIRPEARSPARNSRETFSFHHGELRPHCLPKSTAYRATGVCVVPGRTIPLRCVRAIFQLWLPAESRLRLASPCPPKEFRLIPAEWAHSAATLLA